ncbi:MAG: hypothetical protein M3Q22_17535, partial [Actinomycetota bacterium]|nr:hypothetical protein [Actinomycetota bacterium]
PAPSADTPPRPDPEHRPNQALLAAVAIVGYSLLPGKSLVQVGAYLVLGATGVAGAVVGAARQGTNEHARPWSFLAVAVLLFLGGDLVRLLLVQLGHQDHLGGLAEVLYLAGYPALIVALSSAFRSWESSRDRAELLDAAIITTGAAVLAWVLLVAPPLVIPVRPCWDASSR